MAYRIIWSPEASADLRGIKEYISSDSEKYAALTTRRIITATRRLTQFPFSRRMVPEPANPNLREIFASSWRIVYRVSGNTITILSVVHFREFFQGTHLSIEP